MRVALVGNMNNNNFSMMRYFRNLNVEADLLLFSDDGIGSLSHFSVESDTWSLEDWAPFVKNIGTPNRLVSILGKIWPWSLFFWGKYLLYCLLRKKNSNLFRPCNNLEIKKILATYDKVIGSGVSPSLFLELGINLDIFYPYSSGIEWVADLDTASALASQGILRKWALNRAKENQIKGIIKAKGVVTGDVGYTNEAFIKIGVSPILMKAPIVYKEQLKSRPPKSLNDILISLKKYDYKIISHVRHEWINPGVFDETTWGDQYSKHNDWIIRAYALFCASNEKLNSILVLFEYGNDWLNSKNLCKELGIDKRVNWLPKMSRKEIMELISECDIGVGEFYSVSRMTFGGAALEIMACGKPVIHGFNFLNGEYESLYKMPPPPFCVASSENEIFQWMDFFANDQIALKNYQKNSLIWFNENSGIGLAKKWLDLLKG
jgi:glycosyltransferase involved in cell wall biosynthesis